MSEPRKTPRTRTRQQGRDGNGASAAVRNGGKRRSGTFTNGNTAARGRSSARQKFESAIRSHITTKDLQEIADRLLKQSKAGSLKAIALLLGYVLGKPINMKDATPLSIKLPNCATAEECVEANSRIFEAVGRGDITIDQAVALAGIVAGARQAVGALDHEDRLQMLEELTT